MLGVVPFNMGPAQAKKKINVVNNKWEIVQVKTGRKGTGEITNKNNNKKSDV